jgi:hypothetical protein
MKKNADPIVKFRFTMTYETDQQFSEFSEIVAAALIVKISRSSPPPGTCMKKADQLDFDGKDTILLWLNEHINLVRQLS